MPHQRQVIREAVRQALLGAGAGDDPPVYATAAGARVYASRVLPHRKPELPVLTVYSLEEAVAGESLQTAPRELTRALSVVIEGWVMATADTTVDDAMDALALEVEAAMHADPYLGGACGESILADTVLELIETGDRMMGLVALTYDVTYYTLAPEAPSDADLDDFERVEATYDLGGEVHEDDQAVDVFTVEEDA